MTAAGDRATRRPGRRRQESEPTPAEIGATLRGARESAGVTLAEVHDRTGVPWHQLEALEAGELGSLPDRRSALVAVQRYADLLALDPGELARTVEKHWSPVVGAAVPSGGASTGAVPTGTGGTTKGTGHLSRYPGDGSHLRAFTQTAQVPSVGGALGAAPNGHGRDLAFARTGVFRAIPHRQAYVRPAPLPLRMAVWLTAVLVAVGLVGLAVHHWQPQWLADLHIIQSTSHDSGSGGAQQPGTSSSSPSSSSSSRSPLVTQTDTGPASSTITVRAANFHVVVAASQRCWVSASTPQSFTPIFSGVLEAGQTSTFDSNSGQLTVELGASQVAVAAKIGNRLVPGWLFKPTLVPFTLNFTSAPGS